MATTLQQIGKVFKVFNDSGKLLGKFKTSQDAIAFMNRIAQSR